MCTGRKGMEDIPSIILMGNTGVGKSTFIHVAGRYTEGSGPQISDKLKSCTKDVQEYILQRPHEHEGELGEVRFIDTPGFNDSEGKGDLVEVGKIIDWLRKRRKTKLACVILLYDLNHSWPDVSYTMKNPSRIPNPIIVITKQPLDASNSADIEQQFLRKLGDTKSVRFNLKHFDETCDSAWKIVGDGVGLYDTEAATMGDLRKYLQSIRPRLKLVDKIVEWFSDLFL